MNSKAILKTGHDRGAPDRGSQPWTCSVPSRPRVLIVDDDDAVRQSLEKLLEGEDYETETAADAQEALEKFEVGRYSLVLLDLAMPRMDGWQALEWLRSQEPLLPVVLITGQRARYDRALVSGAGALIEKPLEVPRLLWIISELSEEPLENRLKRSSGVPYGFRYVSPRPSGYGYESRPAGAACPLNE